MSDQCTHLLKRLTLIDLYLFFRGQISRADLIKHFDIGVATASRTLKKYRELHKQNIMYSISDRSYVATDTFQPAYRHDVHRMLMLIAYGLDVREVEGARFAQEAPAAFTAPLCTTIVSAVTKALVQGKGVDISYASGQSGATERTLFPHALFQGGGAWYLRAFDSLRNAHRTFKLNRILFAKENGQPNSERPVDVEWQQQITLTLAPHPQRANQEALKEDLGLVDKPVRNIQTNAVTAIYFLIDLRVDCSLKGNLDPYAYPLRLMNRHDLLGLSGMEITPGFSEKV